MRALTPLAPQLVAQPPQARRRKIADRSRERFGVAALARPPGQLVWIHGASVGEVLAAATLIERLRGLGFQRAADVRHRDVGRGRGKALRRRRHPPVHPLRFSALRRALLEHWQPSLALFVESDLWPNLIDAASAAPHSDDHRQRPRCRRVPSNAGAMRAAPSRRCSASSISASRNRMAMPNASRRSAARAS